MRTGTHEGSEESDADGVDAQLGGLVEVAAGNVAPTRDDGETELLQEERSHAVDPGANRLQIQGEKS